MDAVSNLPQRSFIRTLGSLLTTPLPELWVVDATACCLLTVVASTFRPLPINPLQNKRRLINRLIHEILLREIRLI